MGIERNDGSVQSANTPVYDRMAKNRIDRDHGIYRCMITRVYFSDDPANLTFDNKQVTYEAVILGGPKEGQIIPNVKTMNDYGGEFNYAEKIYRPIETKELKQKRISEHKGDIVYIAFLQGNVKAPVILGGGVHPLDKDLTGAKKEEGFRVRSEYNGVFEEINKLGEYELRRKGGELNTTTGVLTPGKEFEARFKLFKNKMLWEDPNSSILFEKEELKLTISVGKGAIVETFDGKAKKLTRKVGDITIEEDGAAKKMTATIGDSIMVVDGSSKKITLTAGSTVIEIDGNSGKIKLTGDFVDVGKSVSDFAVLFTELSTAFNTHTHQYFPGPGGPTPTTPPMAPLLQTVGSTSVKLQP